MQHIRSNYELIFIHFNIQLQMMRIIGYLFLILVVCYSKLVFEDNFNKLDFSKWRHDLTLSGGGNNEFQIYDNNRTTTYVKDSILYIQPVPTEQKIGADAVRNNSVYDLWGGSPGDFCTSNSWNGCRRESNGNTYINPVFSGKLTTVQSFSFTYGRVEVRAKLPKGDWLWPAIWLMPSDFEYGSWPASGEIDIMESRGNVGYPKENGGGPEAFCSTLHWGSDWTTNQFWKTRGEYHHKNGTLADDFHVYGLYWDDKVIYTYLDNDTNRILFVNHSSMSYWERSGLTNRSNPWQHSPNKNAPFDTNFYLILNVAVGGTVFFADGVANKPWSNNSPRASAEFFDNKGQWINSWKGASAMQIDSVKIWDLSGKIQEVTQ